jgi:hypothetical protein
MRKLLSALLLVFAVSLPFAANAGMGVEASLGKGWEVQPDSQQQPLNLMVAPGYSFMIVKLQVGLVADLPDVENSKFDIGVRPMLTISPPILPLYARLILAFNTLKEDATLAYGGAVGLGFGLAGVGIFAEAGILPRNQNDQFRWVVEGRAGVSLGF